MGIFDKLFKPSPEELKAKEDVQRAQNLIANQEWDQLVEIGKPAVKPLILCLRDNKDVDILVAAARTLGRIGDIEAVDQLGVCIVSMEAALNDRFGWDFYNTLMPVVADALTSIEKSNAEQIIKFLKKKESLLIYGIPFMWALCEIGDRKATEAVVNWIFSVGSTAPTIPGSMGTPLTYQQKLLSPSGLIRMCVPPTVIPKLLDDYTDLILDLFSWELVSYSAETDRLQFDVSRCSEAVQRLCEIKTPISSNILHKVSEINEVNVGFQYGGVQSRTEYLDFKENQEMAIDELKRRGKPRYDTSVYHNQDAWRI